MSKDKGTKNHKKAPADKSSGKRKVLSAYKAESQSKQNALSAFSLKPDPKVDEGRKH